MRSVNKVILIGNLTRDPNVRQTPNGQLVATFGVATNRQWTTQSNEKHNMAEFHELVAWARLAELAEKHLRKGKLVYVEGYLSTRSWETPEGVKKFKTEIVVQDLIMLDKRGDAPEVPLEKDSKEEKKSEEKAPAEEPKEETETPEEAPAEEPKEETKTPEEAPAEEQKEETEIPEEAPAEEQKEEESLIDKDLGL